MDRQMGVLGGLAVALVGAVAGARANELPEMLPPPRPGVVVADFVLPDLAQRACRLSEFIAPVVVLNFWAFWCDTWAKQLPQLRQLALRQEELGFRLLAVSVDGQWTDARRRLGREGLPFPVLLDVRKSLTGRLGVRRVPTVMVLDGQRRVTWLHEAYPGNPAVLRAIRAAGR